MPNPSDVIGWQDLSVEIPVGFRDRSGPIAEMLQEAVAACARSAALRQAKSSFALTMTFEPDGGRILIVAKLDAKLPQPATLPVAAYVDPNLRLCRDDPRQMRLADVVDLSEETEAEGGAQ
jgi:hypothetical protein